MKADKAITDLGFEPAGKMPRHSGSGLKRSLPLFNISWSDIVKEPTPNYKGVISADDARAIKQLTLDTWLRQVDVILVSRLDTLRELGYTIEDPILSTYAHKYSAFFIYKAK